MTRVTLATANTPGAVAILQLHGQGVTQTLEQLTGRSDWRLRIAMLCNFAGIDEGLAVLLSQDNAQLMPHGGPRVVQKLIGQLTTDLGCSYDAQPDTRVMFPEASSPIQADMLDAIARAASPAAIELLANQPALWAGLFKQACLTPEQRQSIADRSRILDRLIMPPTVLVVGPPNVGKSTLTNALLGQTISIVADLPGTTRDWVGAMVELSGDGSTRDAVAVNWLDTPGLRQSDDTIEQRAIHLASKQFEQADVLIAMRDPDQVWPDASTLSRDPDLWVLNKVDVQDASAGEGEGDTPDRPLQISARQGRGLDALQACVIDSLGLTTLDQAEPWAFSPTLRHWCESEHLLSEGYVG